MQLINTARLHSVPPATPPAQHGETLGSRHAALDRYCQLFARGHLPILLEETDGTFRVFLSSDQPPQAL